MLYTTMADVVYINLFMKAEVILSFILLQIDQWKAMCIKFLAEGSNKQSGFELWTLRLRWVWTQDWPAVLESQAIFSSAKESDVNYKSPFFLIKHKRSFLIWHFTAEFLYTHICSYSFITAQLSWYCSKCRQGTSNMDFGLQIHKHVKSSDGLQKVFDGLQIIVTMNGSSAGHFRSDW